MEIASLSDKQLIELFRNSKLDKELKTKIINEIDKRDLLVLPPVEKEIDFNDKLKIFFTGYFLYKYHVKKSSELLISGNKKGYKKYWNYFNLGLLFYIVVFLLIVKYFIKPL